MKEELKNDDGSGMPTICERRIWKFYEWAVILAPIVLMVSHWYIFYLFSQNKHELMHYSDENEICIAWIYTVLYLYIPIMILPATYFFKWCNMFRVPFVYFIFINVERWEYGSWFCTNEMVKTHIVLIKCIMGLYAFELVEIFLSNLSNIVNFGKNCIVVSYLYIKRGVLWIKDKMFTLSEEEERNLQELEFQLFRERMEKRLKEEGMV